MLFRPTPDGPVTKGAYEKDCDMIRQENISQTQNLL